ncbi:MAG: Rrf2 family transcriptional regulator [Microthrixaceae bacterium]|jgi:Rrf2 family protein|nr:Rrf2 family transcriptional regulator [Microthrixaceae bacterium]
MRIGEGVEWGAHVCLLLDWLGPDATVPAVKLAAAFELPAPYLNKQLQLLVRAGILESTRGGNGGFALRRGLGSITMYDVVAAVEGEDPAFRCSEIRRCGIGARSPRSSFAAPCAIAATMHDAEAQWRQQLSSQTLADVQADAERSVPGLREQTRQRFAAL